MSGNPLPRIDLDRCTGCHLCVDICPTQALTDVAGKAMLLYPGHCTYCTVCEDVCPENAISLPFLIVLGSRK
jgi:formate hydrogenlyase subunit 6/NADH:ubiquinone oxidoreductase subunit I